ncbi:MOSC domain-containing protein [Leptothoe kymatousa]|uniref:MOSC domain-containing protein n=1 Tax=Leptothoe kymatousa TAU-MAC 1615 TaxID=2364775 RepID=A0ABS5Y0S2_9CYAN|nr:MOSC domain-containing protein [Leptothoe kymatousa]MBT9311420.1 MOSC domain-containing protein [Leptothoe kymatousa TAU-MAC 1615]
MAVPASGRILHINISDGGTPKLPIPTVDIGVDGLVGDRQKNLKYHGGPDRAVCLWSAEIIQMLQTEGHPIHPGSAGENITVEGLPWQDLQPDTLLQVGDTVRLMITDYAAPCRTIGKCFSDRKYSRISQKHFPGTSRLYARVLTPGTVAVGNSIFVPNAP